MNELIEQKPSEGSIPVTAVVRLKHGILHALAKKLGSQSAAARELGVRPDVFCGWINLNRRPPKWKPERAAEFAAKILELTGCTVDEIWPEGLDSILGTIQTTGETTQYIEEISLKELRYAEPMKI